MLSEAIKSILSVIFLSSLLLTVSGCSSTWQAPVYSYSSADKKPTHKKRVYGNYYKVVKGDTLYAIAWRTNNNFTDLASWNNLSAPHTIYVGQRLAIKRPVNFKKATKKVSSSKPKVSASTPKKPSKKIIKKASKTEKFKEAFRWKWPTKGKIIKGFKFGDDTRKGILVKGKVGQSILAAEDGKVVYSGSGLIGYGKLIIIKHNNKYLSAYGHNKKILVKEGSWVTKGKKIAEMGWFETNVAALHFEIRKNGTPINPASLLSK